MQRGLKGSMGITGNGSLFGWGPAQLCPKAAVPAPLAPLRKEAAAGLDRGRSHGMLDLASSDDGLLASDFRMVSGFPLFYV
jgi:hypothetical protein